MSATLLEYGNMYDITKREPFVSSSGSWTVKVWLGDIALEVVFIPPFERTTRGLVAYGSIQGTNLQVRMCIHGSSGGQLRLM
jgi:hypothetical protein